MKIPYQSNQRQVMPTGGSAQNIALQSTPGLNPFLDTVVKISGEKFEESKAKDLQQKQLGILKDLNKFNNDTEINLREIEDPVAYEQQRQTLLADKVQQITETYDSTILDPMSEALATWEMKWGNRTVEEVLRRQNILTLRDVEKTVDEITETEYFDTENANVSLQLFNKQLDDMPPGTMTYEDQQKIYKNTAKSIITNLASNHITQSVNQLVEEANDINTARALIPGLVKDYEKIQALANKEVGINTITKKQVQDYSNILERALIDREIVKRVREGNPAALIALDTSGISGTAKIEAKKAIADSIKLATTKQTDNTVAELVDPLSNMDLNLTSPELFQENLDKILDGKFDDEKKQKKYNDLDSEGKLKVKESALAFANKMDASIKSRKARKVLESKEKNDEIFVKARQDIKDGTLTIAQIEKLKLSEDEDGERIRDSLITYYTLYTNKNLPTDVNIDLENKIKEKILDKEILDINQQFQLENEAEPLSIFERMLRGNLTDGQMDRSEALLSKVDDPVTLKNEALINGFVQGFKTTVQGGTLASINPTAGIDFFNFENLMRERFDEGLKNKIDPTDLVNPSSKHYIGKDIDNFISTQNEIIERMSQSLGREREDPPPEDNRNQFGRKPEPLTMEEWENMSPIKTGELPSGMSYDEIIETKQYKDWYKRKPKQ